MIVESIPLLWGQDSRNKEAAGFFFFSSIHFLLFVGISHGLLSLYCGLRSQNSH